MAGKLKPIEEEKLSLHPRSLHRDRYDFSQLVKRCPELANFVSTNKFQEQSIDFANPSAVKALNKALLNYFYGISLWDTPEGYLCPPIPGRADYIHYMADVLASCNGGVIPRKRYIKVLDIGVGASCIYPIIGFKEYGWNFVGSDIDYLAIRFAKNIIEANSLSKAIDIRRQAFASNIFVGIFKPGELFDLSICNPPFHSSLQEATDGATRKWRNLGQEETNKSAFNFGGQNTELWCEGGEDSFVYKMINESVKFSKNCFWFSSLISKKTTLSGAYKTLEKVKALEIKTIDMAQGNKISRILVWTFLNKSEQEEWRLKRWKKE